MELEAKYRLSDPALAERLLALRALGPFTLTPDAAPEQQVNTYYDTADARLSAAHFGLRSRAVAGRLTATLKGPATAQGAVTAREELEQPVPQADPQTWPAGLVRDRLTGLIGDTPLRATVSITTVRHHLYAARGAVRFAEISLDAGQFRAGERVAPFRELEVELLLPAAQADFATLIELLERSYPLTPEPRSKLERALALQDDQHSS